MLSMLLYASLNNEITSSALCVGARGAVSGVAETGVVCVTSQPVISTVVLTCELGHWSSISATPSISLSTATGVNSLHALTVLASFATQRAT